MTYEIPGKMLPKESAGDNSLNQFRAMVVNASGQLVLAGAGAVMAGVLQNKPGAQGRAANYMINGVSKGVAGAVIAAGAAVEVDANGKFIPHATGSIVGYAEEAAVNINDLFPLRITAE